MSNYESKIGGNEKDVTPFYPVCQSCDQQCADNCAGTCKNSCSGTCWTQSNAILV